MFGSGLAAEPVNVEAVDGVEVTIVVDNFVDVLMAGAEGVHRYLAHDFADRDQLVAEHGEAVSVMRLIKKALDPDNIMNPGKIVRV